MEIDLRGQVATGVDLVEHSQRSVLRVTEVILRIGQIDTLGEAFLIASASVYILSLVAVDNGCTGILAERELTLGGHLGVAQHGKRYELVVFTGLGIVEDFGHHLVVLPAEHESIVVCSLSGEHGEGLRIYDEHLVAVPVLGLHIIGCQMIILRCVGRHRKHFLVSEWFGCHSLICLYLDMIGKVSKFGIIKQNFQGAIRVGILKSINNTE